MSAPDRGAPLQGRFGRAKALEPSATVISLQLQPLMLDAANDACFVQLGTVASSIIGGLRVARADANTAARSPQRSPAPVD